MTNFLQRIKDFFKPSKESINEKHPLDGPVRASNEKALKLYENKPVISEPVKETPIAVQEPVPTPVPAPVEIVRPTIKETAIPQQAKPQPKVKKPVAATPEATKSKAIAKPRKPRAKK
jgi:hypothetical protein